jgi:hypothetical protein
MTIEIRAGNSAFADETKNFTEDSNGCYRVILMRSMGYEQAPKDSFEKMRQSITFAVGHACEDVHEEYHTSLGRLLEKEKAGSKEYYPGVPCNCHADFVVTDERMSATWLEEHKSVSSINTWLQVFERGSPKANNIAQCLTNCDILDVLDGRLIYTGVIYSPGGRSTAKTTEQKEWPPIQPYAKMFTVNKDDNGVVYLNGEEYEYSWENVLIHKREASRCVAKEEVSKIKPATSKACSYCSLKKICKLFDGGQINQEEWKRLATLEFKERENG